MRSDTHSHYQCLPRRTRVLPYKCYLRLHGEFTPQKYHAGVQGPERDAVATGPPCAFGWYLGISDPEVSPASSLVVDCGYEATGSISPITAVHVFGPHHTQPFCSSHIGTYFDAYRYSTSFVSREQLMMVMRGNLRGWGATSLVPCARVLCQSSASDLEFSPTTLWGGGDALLCETG